MEKALKNGDPILALESTIISHGMPFPQNLQTAIDVEQIARSNGVVPATIAILNGKIHVGLSEEQLHTSFFSVYHLTLFELWLIDVIFSKLS